MEDYVLNLEDTRTLLQWLKGNTGLRVLVSREHTPRTWIRDESSAEV